MELEYIFFDANTIEPQAWKNGGGQTQDEEKPLVYRFCISRLRTRGIAQ